MKPLIKTVLCKKYYRSGGDVIYGEFMKGEYYNHFQLEKWNNSPLTNDDKDDFKYIYIWNNHRPGGIRVHFELGIVSMPNMGLPYFYDYFCNEIELRKEKLKQIENDKENA